MTLDPLGSKSVLAVLWIQILINSCLILIWIYPQLYKRKNSVIFVISITNRSTRLPSAGWEPALP